MEQEGSASSESHREGAGGEESLLERLLMETEEEPDFSAEVKEMLKNEDSRLKYVLAGDAIENPFINDREEQLNFHMNLYCVTKPEGGYKCVACDEEYDDVDAMRQHILFHMKAKFYLCVQCLEGYSTLSAMRAHIRRHSKSHFYSVFLLSQTAQEKHVLIVFFFEKVNESLPLSIRKFLEQLRSPEGFETASPPSPKRPKMCSTKKKCNPTYSCNICSSTFNRLDTLLLHTEQEHPSARNVIDKLRLELLHAAFDPQGYRSGGDREGGSPSSSSELL
ncbi:unnamed protein product [Hydatigera taeniaeformis]|uniref:C2H2-type domain-containing protein n=1 Tax=Hydatigena taeniaeformis TaxID=6205 RepID=A0A0R3X7K6_HYDTA|nr:unnamed protein product [Hydatigera taeniaeformis]